MAIVNGTPQNDNNTGASFGGFLGLVLQTKNFRPALIGTLGDDQIFGDAGNDILVGLTGDDLLDGGTGADTMFGGFGDDVYIVDNVGDLVGEWLNTDGTDLVKSSVTYSLNGPTFSLPGISGVANNAAAALPVIGLGLEYLPYLALTLLPLTPQFIENLTLTGTDNIDGEGNALDNVITGNSGNNKLFGLAGDDVFIASTGDDTIDGGGDYDTADYSSVAGAITLNGTGDLTLTVVKPSGTDTLLNIEEVIADASASNNTIDFSGADPGITINVDLSADSILISGASNLQTLVKVVNFDDVTGTSGDDTITGDDQANNLFGGSGNDSIYGGEGDDNINGNMGDDLLYGDIGNDTVRGGKDNDTVYGGEGDDLLYGDLGNDSVFGEAGNDTLYGGDGNDTLDGGCGDDLISGGAEKDILTGGSGNDLFDYTTLTDSRIGISWFNVNLSKVDVITDFKIGEDKFLVQSAPTNNGFFSPAVRHLNVNSIFGLGATVLGLATLGAYDAAQITVGSGLGARTFVAINNGSFGFNANTDAFIELTNFSGKLSVSDFATPVV
ncbi:MULTISPECIES: calcium-binding protein [unclassified Synechocystis]|uniref:calcium-binding protein n=1 Tax=unclassified Synechocystis TaxID=2640012 RepID=UPI0004063DFA|nr:MULTISPECIES: calcium-binding protein [unclassified Synechocystis]AIE75692.1 Alkaline phosphatase [Synechocystis sp. PCC 6714]MCT0253877.1 calcium-binding protein [Synechocystis sp. CS-94]